MRLIRATLTTILSLLVITGCSLFAPWELMPQDLMGTWTKHDDFYRDIQTLTFRDKTFTMTSQGSFNGTWNCAIKAVDQASRHIKMTTMNATGDLIVLATDAPQWYWYYEIIGDELRVDFDWYEYPTEAYLYGFHRD